jgi:hypothetical protein
MHILSPPLWERFIPAFPIKLHTGEGGTPSKTRGAPEGRAKETGRLAIRTDSGGVPDVNGLAVPRSD